MTTISPETERLQRAHVLAGDLLAEVAASVPGVQLGTLTIDATLGFHEIHLHIDPWHYEATVEYLGLGPVYRNGGTSFAGGVWREQRVHLHCWVDADTDEQPADRKAA